MSTQSLSHSAWHTSEVMPILQKCKCTYKYPQIINEKEIHIQTAATSGVIL